MKRILILAFCALCLLGNTVDKKLTPGVIDKKATKKDVCTPGYSKAHRNVTSKQVREVYESYGIKFHMPGDYEIDHLISLELGGTNDNKNLWPQSYREKPGALEKDRVENNLHWRVCTDKISLQRAQSIIRNDWKSYYEKLEKKK